MPGCGLKKKKKREGKLQLLHAASSDLYIKPKPCTFACTFDICNYTEHVLHDTSQVTRATTREGSGAEVGVGVVQYLQHQRFYNEAAARKHVLCTSHPPARLQTPSARFEAGVKRGESPLGWSEGSVFSPDFRPGEGLCPEQTAFPMAHLSFSAK